MNKFANELDDFKNLTITEIALKILKESPEPIHILDLSIEVMKINTETNWKSINSAIQIDKTGIFELFSQSFIGLKEKRNSDEYKPYYKFPRNFGKTIISFVNKNQFEDNYEYVVYVFKERYNLKLDIIRKLIDFQIKLRNLKIQNNILTTTNK